MKLMTPNSHYSNSNSTSGLSLALSSSVKRITSVIGVSLLFAGLAQSATVTYGISTTGIGTAANGDFSIASNATNTLIDTTNLTVGRVGSPWQSLPEYRSFMLFDVAGLASLEMVTDAKLRIYRNDIDSGPFNWGNASIFALTSEFTPGGASDYDELGGTALGTLLTPSDGTNQYFEMDVTALVESWRLNPSANYGFAIRGTEGNFNGTGKTFDSATGTFAPQLLVSTIPEPTGAISGILLVAGMLLRRRH